jgi:hypothetical protein
MKFIKLPFIFILLMALTMTSAYAKKFTSQYCEFELPPGWECGLEGTEWVCQSLNKDRKKESIIILAAKIRGSNDSLDKYQAYLKQVKSFNLPGGKTQVSEPKYTKLEEINTQRWVDSLHMASEVPGFYTRYLATVKEDLGVAVTFSVSKEHYASYQAVFDNIVKTLRVFRQKASNVGDFKLKKKDEDLLDSSTFIPDQSGKFDIGAQKQKKGSGSFLDDDLTLIVGAIAVVALILIILKKRKKK